MAGGIDEGAARRYYDRFGASLKYMEPFESRAKAWTLERLRGLGAGQTALEIGVGLGDGLRAAAATGARVFGLDLSEAMLARARAAVPEGSPTSLICGSASALPLRAASLDLALSMYVLDLLPEAAIRAALGECARVVKPGGRLLLCGLTEGQGLFSRAVMGLWRGLYRLSPESLGGCRPLRLESLIDEELWRLEERAVFTQKGLASEALSLTRTAPVRGC